jgi:hypothetical protein
MTRKKTSRGRSKTPTATAAEQFAAENLESAIKSARRSFDDLNAYTKLNPQTALLSAVGVGYILRILPVSRILSRGLRFLVSLFIPAALVFGASKLLEGSRSDDISARKSSRPKRRLER